MEDNLLWKAIFEGRQPSVVDNHQRKTTFDGGQPLVENDLRWKTNFSGPRPLVLTPPLQSSKILGVPLTLCRVNLSSAWSMQARISEPFLAEESSGILSSDWSFSAWLASINQRPRLLCAAEIALQKFRVTSLLDANLIVKTQTPTQLNLSLT